MNTDFNIFDFVDILYIVLIPIAIMVWMTFWLQQQQRSRKMILSIWGGFVGIVIVGLVCLLIGIQSVRTQWLTYFSEMAAAYAVFATELDHWTIVVGDEDIFSDWSAPVKPVPLAENQDPMQQETPRHEVHEILEILEIATANDAPKKLAIPEHLSAVRISPTHVSLRWMPVPGATTYRVQWGKPGTPWDEGGWEAVYSGAACECSIEDADTEHLYRVRAETGTPEDDPTYLVLLDAFDSAALVSRYIASAYTMRPVVGEDAGMFIICPATDINGNGVIDPNERAAPIGEIYLNTAAMRHVFSTQTHGTNTIPITDEWGTWVTAFHPLFDPEGNFDGVVGIDFDYSLWSGALAMAKIWPYSFFFILTLLFFGSTYLIVLNQRSREATECSAAELQDSVVQLTAAKVTAEAAVRAKGHFLANMSHEIRTPMNAVLGFAQIIGRRLMERCRPEEREQCREAVDLITSSGNDLLTIINDILDFTKVDSDQITVESIPVSLGETIEHIHSIMQARLSKRENLTLVLTDDGGVPELILSDPTRLRQILSNLVGNAIKFTQTGTITVRYGKNRENMLFVEVRDTGIGMSPEQLRYLFQPFSQADSSLTRRFGGTGLGLSISKRLAHLLGGDIRVSSTEGEGSVFTLFLPNRIPSAEDLQHWDAKQQRHVDLLAEAQSEGDQESKDTEGSEDAAPSLAGFNILVVDDGRINQIVISTQLTEAGAQITLADNGLAAIETINANESAGSPFDVVLMDMQMPVLDGYEATSRLRSEGYVRPIIAITAHALSGDCEKTLEVGCDAYLSKPVNRELLIKTILEMCR